MTPAEQDAAVLMIGWLIFTALGLVVMVLLSRKIGDARRRRDHLRRRLPPPDRTLHRTGSVVDFKRRLDASRWP